MAVIGVLGSFTMTKGSRKLCIGPLPAGYGVETLAPANICCRGLTSSSALAGTGTSARDSIVCWPRSGSRGEGVKQVLCSEMNTHTNVVGMSRVGAKTMPTVSCC